MAEKTFFLSGIIDRDLLKEWISFKNENQSDNWVIIIDSAGGSSRIARLLAFDFNQKGQSCKVIANSVFSAAFEIFLLCVDTQRFIVKDSLGMVHLGSLDVNINSRKEVCDEDKIILAQIKERDKNYGEDFLTPKELRKFKTGYDVYLSFKRMTEIFPEVKVI